MSNQQQKRTENKNYFTYLKGGLKFLLADKVVFFFFIGTALIAASFTVWGSIMLLPLYYGYSGSDSVASIFRTIMFLCGIPIGLYIAKISKRFSTNKTPLFFLIAALMYFPPLIILVKIIPLNNTLSLIGLTLIAIILTFSNPMAYDTANTLNRRTTVDLVPSENRNAVYSLIPSIITIFGIPLLPFTGIIIERFGFSAGMIVVFLINLSGVGMLFLSFYHKKRRVISDP